MGKRIKALSHILSVLLAVTEKKANHFFAV